MIRPDALTISRKFPLQFIRRCAILRMYKGTCVWAQVRILELHYSTAAGNCQWTFPDFLRPPARILGPVFVSVPPPAGKTAFPPRGRFHPTHAGPMWAFFATLRARPLRHGGPTTQKAPSPGGKRSLPGRCLLHVLLVGLDHLLERDPRRTNFIFILRGPVFC